MKRIVIVLLLLALGVGGSPVQATLTVESVIEAMADKMAGVESLEMETSLRIIFPGDDDSEEHVQNVRLVMQRPDRLFLDADTYIFFADGENATVAFSMFEVALQRHMTGGLADLMEDQEAMFGDLPLPDVKALLSADPAEVLRGVVEDFTVKILPEEEHEGRPVWVVWMDVEVPGTSFPDGVRVLIDQETGLMIGLRARVDMDVSEWELMGEVPQSYDLAYDARFLSINAPIDLDVFAFDLSGYTIVDSQEALMEAFQSGSGSARPESIAVGTAAPDFELTLLDDSMFRLSDHLGRVVLVDFWATWCPPCVQSLPYLQGMYEELAGEDVEFVGVSLDRLTARQRVETMVRQFSLGYPIGINEDGEIATDYGAVSIPTLVVVDREGVVRHVKVGFSEPAMAQVAELVRELVGKQE